MRIDRIRLQDVGPFEDATIEFPAGQDPNLADVYLLTGQNGTGKSTILYALASMIACGGVRRRHRGQAPAVPRRSEAAAHR